jgi:hypothetical protein
MTEEEREIVHLEDLPEGTVIPDPITEESIRVPLTIYVGEERRILGHAIVTGNDVQAYYDPVADQPLLQAIQHGTIQSVSLQFNAPPAIPVLEDGHVRWKKAY